MASGYVSKIFVIGATGAQGLPVVAGLTGGDGYEVIALTRDTSSRRAGSLREMPGVSLLEGRFDEERTLREGFRACDGAFVNIDGFTVGEKTEMFWAMRAYEIALEEGVRFFVYGNLDYTLKKAGYDPRFRTGHYDGKGRIGEWILAQNRDNGPRMGAALFTTGPYMEMAFSAMTPMTPSIEDGVVTWRVPLGDGAVAHVALEDCAYYVRWLFDHADQANGMDLEVGIEHVRYADLAAAFERVTGRPARYVDTPVDAYFGGALRVVADRPAGVAADPADPSTMSFRQNFTGFWNQWKHGVISRDYALLDTIHPNRIRTVEDWLRRQEEIARVTGTDGLWERLQPERIAEHTVLKLSEDGHRRRVR